MDSSDEIILFPFYKILASCLNNHPLTGTQTTEYFSEKGVTEAVAKYFADREKFPSGVDLGVMLALYDLNKELELPSPIMGVMGISFAEALKDCAAENSPSKKSDL